MEKRKGSVTERVEEIAVPLANEMGLRLWDFDFHKEGSDWYLVFYLDKEGGVSINDCEAFSRAVDVLLDEADPIEQSYYLEVSSAGMERTLRKDAHFLDSIGEEICVKLYQSINGEKTLEGFLESYQNGDISLKRYDGTVSFLEKGKWASVNIKADFS